MADAPLFSDSTAQQERDPGGRDALRREEGGDRPWLRIPTPPSLRDSAPYNPRPLLQPPPQQPQQQQQQVQSEVDKLCYATILAHVGLDSPVSVALRSTYDARFRRALRELFMAGDVVNVSLVLAYVDAWIDSIRNFPMETLVPPEALDSFIPTDEAFTAAQFSDTKDTNVLVALRDALRALSLDASVSSDVALRARAILGDHIVENMFITALAIVEVGALGYDLLRIAGDPTPPSLAAPVWAIPWRTEDQPLAGKMLGAIVKFMLVMDNIPLPSTTVKLTQDAAAALADLFRHTAELTVWGREAPMAPFVLHEMARMLSDWSPENWLFKASTYWDALPAETRENIAIKAYARDFQVIFGTGSVLETQDTLKARMRDENNMLWGNAALLRTLRTAMPAFARGGLADIHQAPTVLGLYPCSLLRGLRLCADKLASTAKGLVPQCIRPAELGLLMGPRSEGVGIYQLLHAPPVSSGAATATHAHPLSNLRFLATKTTWASPAAQATAIRQIERAIEPICTADRERLFEGVVVDAPAFRDRVVRMATAAQRMIEQGRLVPDPAEDADIAQVAPDIARRAAQDIKNILNTAGKAAPVVFVASAGKTDDLERRITFARGALEKYEREIADADAILAVLGEDAPERATVFDRKRQYEALRDKELATIQGANRELEALRELAAVTAAAAVGDPVPVGTLADIQQTRERAIQELTDYELGTAPPAMMVSDEGQSALTRVFLAFNAVDPDTWRTVTLPILESALGEAQAHAQASMDDTRWSLYTIHGIARVRAMLSYKYLLGESETPATARRLQSLLMGATLMFHDTLYGIALDPTILPVTTRERIFLQYDYTWMERYLLYAPYISTITSVVLAGTHGMQLRDIFSSYLAADPSVLEGVATIDNVPLKADQAESMMDQLIAVFQRANVGRANAEEHIELQVGDRMRRLVLEFSGGREWSKIAGVDMEIPDHSKLEAALKAIRKGTSASLVAKLVTFVRNIRAVNTDIKQAPGFALSWLWSMTGVRRRRRTPEPPKPISGSLPKPVRRVADIVQVSALLAEAAKSPFSHGAMTIAAATNLTMAGVQPLPTTQAEEHRDVALLRFRDILGVAAAQTRDPWAGAEARAAFLDATVVPAHALFYRPSPSPPPSTGAVVRKGARWASYIAFALVIQNVIFNTITDQVAHGVLHSTPDNTAGSWIQTIGKYMSEFLATTASGVSIGAVNIDVPSVLLTLIATTLWWLYAWMMNKAFTKTLRVAASVGPSPGLSAAVTSGAIEVTERVLGSRALPIGGKAEERSTLDMWTDSKTAYRLARTRLQADPVPRTALAVFQLIAGNFVTFVTAPANAVPYGAHALHGVEVFRNGAVGTYASFPGMIESDTYKMIFADPATRANVALSLDLATAGIDARIMSDSARVLIKFLATDAWYVITNRVSEMKRTALPDDGVRYDDAWQGIFNIARMLDAIANIPDASDPTNRLGEMAKAFDKNIT